jgi:hypothetical protein
MLFNKPSDLTYRDWSWSKAQNLLSEIRNVVEWIPSEDMTDKEKSENPTFETTGGYLKAYDKAECGQMWWNSLSDTEKDIIKAIPNFDAEIFAQCTGVNVNA